jgi:hypothetical protein
VRRITLAAAATAAAALSAVLFSGTANAATAYPVSTTQGDGGLSARAATANPPKPIRIGKIHNFTVPSIKGASAHGDWYWAHYKGGKSFVWMDFYVKDTRADGKSAGMCYYLTSPAESPQNRCIVNTQGSGKTLHQIWTMGYWNQDHLKVQTDTGRLRNKTFYVATASRWLKLH